jgi:hypothetical protein
MEEELDLDFMAKKACEYVTGLKWEGLSERGRITWRSGIHNALLGLLNRVSGVRIPPSSPRGEP